MEDSKWTAFKLSVIVLGLLGVEDPNLLSYLPLLNLIVQTRSVMLLDIGFQRFWTYLLKCIKKSKFFFFDDFVAIFLVIGYYISHCKVYSFPKVAKLYTEEDLRLSI